MKPQIFGEYLLISRLAERSMAEVYLAVRLGDRTGRMVVLKRASIDEAPSGAIAESLRRELEVLKEGRIQGIAALQDHGEVGGLPFIVLEHVPGHPLDALIAAGALDREAAMLLGKDLARTLAALHARGWIHGDVTPSNILIDDTGEATLIDLGIARRVGESREMPAGKPGYASPEAAIGKAAAPSDDVYGWGVVIAECLLGGRLFRETDLAEAAVRRAHLPPAIEQVDALAAALSMEPDRRPAAKHLVESLAVDADKRRTLANAVLSAELRAGATGPVQRTSSDPWQGRGAAATDMGRMVQARSERPGAPQRPQARRLLGAIFGVSLALALVGGFVMGRRTAPKQTLDTSLSLPLLPARAEIKLDGRTQLSPSPAREVPIDPGAHKLSIQIAKREPREFEFVAEAGDHVVVVVMYGKNSTAGGSSKNNLTDPD